jgi:hypothetical protein
MFLPEQKYPNTTRTISGLINLVTASDVVLQCTTASNPVALTLLEIPSSSWSTQYKLYVIDNSNNAQVNNITINAPVGYTINGFSSIVINQNGGQVVIEVSSNTSYLARYNYGSAANLLTVQDEGVDVTTNTSKINFTGDLVTVTGSGSTATVNVSQTDSGWLNLLGFSFIPNTFTALPQMRLIGKQVFFRGIAFVPLASDALGTTLVPLTVSGVGANYVNDPYPYTYRGVGGCTTNSNGSISFNQGASVFHAPYSGLTLSRTIQKSLINGFRIVATSAANTGTVLNGVFTVSMTSSGVLQILTLKDYELSPAIPNTVNGFGSSTLRMISTSIESGQYPINWLDADVTGSKTQSHSANSRFSRSFSVVNAANTFNFSCDTSEERQIGGFIVSLDGLSGFID